MGRRKEIKQSVNMRMHILDTARELMVKKGIKETSLKDIAKAAEISTGTLYYHYSAKEDIIYEIAEGNLQQITNDLLARIDHISSDMTPERVLREVFDKILAADTRGRLHLYLLSDAGTTDGAISDKFKGQYNEWRKILESCLNKILPQNNEVLSYLILAMLDGLVIQKMLGAENIPVEEMIHVILGKGSC